MANPEFRIYMQSPGINNKKSGIFDPGCGFYPVIETASAASLPRLPYVLKLSLCITRHAQSAPASTKNEKGPKIISSHIKNVSVART